jgi:hypothetical protein
VGALGGAVRLPPPAAASLGSGGRVGYQSGMSGYRPAELERVLAEMGRRSFRSLPEAQAWLDRRMAEYNAAPQAALGGLSPVQVARLLDGDWVSAGALRVVPEVADSELAGARFLQAARLLLRLARDEGALPVTAAGNLTRRSLATLLSRIPWPDARPPLGRESGVVNEQDIHLVHLPRVVLGLAGLLVRRKGFHVTRRGRALLDEHRAGELFTELFRTFFRRLNLAYLDRGPPQPGLQQTIAFSIFQVGRHASNWAGAEPLAERGVLPGVHEPTGLALPGNVSWRFATRLLYPLSDFGLLEHRLVGDGPEWQRTSEFRKTPLFDRVLRFELDPGPAGNIRSAGTVVWRRE